MLKVKELIEKLKEVNQEAYVIFDDDQQWLYPVLGIKENPIDCNNCEDVNLINDYAPCAGVNNVYVPNYKHYCNKHTRKDVVLITTDYQQSADSIKLVME